MEKKKWSTPEIKKVLLVPDECVITACKTGVEVNRPAGTKLCGDVHCSGVGS